MAMQTHCNIHSREIHSTLTAAQQFTRDNPVLHAEYERRRSSGIGWPTDSELGRYVRELDRLNKIAMSAIGV